MTLRQRANIIKNGIVIALPLQKHCETWEQCAKWKNLPEDQFMEKFGNEVLKLYKMPTAEELEQLGKWDEDTDESEAEVEETIEPIGDEE